MERKNFEPWRPWEGSSNLAEDEKFVEPINQQSVNEPLRTELPCGEQELQECITEVAVQLVENPTCKDPETEDKHP